jgi:diadenosine tetraphosphate (Ap4A) HIT family hydrolase
MNCPICSWSKENMDYPFIYETSLWIVKLAPNQSLLGRCVVSTRRHVEDLPHLTHQEVIDFFEIIRQLENALRQAFNATMFNWSCYMNHAYRETSPNPHVHWWVVPRYNDTRELGGITFKDSHFGDPYDHSQWQDVSAEIKAQIIEKIAAALLHMTN